MIQDRNILGSRCGLTLLEAIMAMAMGAMIFIPLFMAFGVAIKTWDEHILREELCQQARIAMDRIVSELRDTVRLVGDDVDDLDLNVLEFYTRNVALDGWEAEIIKYEYNDLETPGNNILYRSQDGGTLYPIAGSDGNPMIGVSAFSYNPYKVEGGIFKDLETGDPISAADGVLVSLSLATGDGMKEISLSSRVEFKNK